MNPAVVDVPAGPAGEQWHRLSPRMLLVHPVIELLRLLPVVAGIVLTGGSRGGSANAVFGLAVAGLVTVLAIARWFTTELRITPEQVELRHGVVRRRSLATRRDRIRTVDVTSHLLHRLLGLSRVVVGTGTSDRKGRDRLVLDGLTAGAARRLRDDLLHGDPVDPGPVATGDPVAPGRPPAAADVPATVATELARLDPRWVRYAPFTLSGVVTGLLLWGFVWRLQTDGVDILHSGPLRSVTHDAEQRSAAVVVAAVLVAVVVFVAVTSVVGYVLAFWNFRLLRHPSGTVEVTRGLFTTRSTSIERRRLVGVRVSEPLLLRAVGGGRLLAVATGLRVGRGAEKGGEALLPPAPAATVGAVARAVLGTAAVDAVLLRHGPRARRRRLVRALAGAGVLLAAGVAGALTGGSAWGVGLGVLLVLTAPLLARDRYAALGHAVRDDHLVVRSGSLVRRRTVLHREAVIGWNVRRTFFQRRAGLATLVATTAAGRGSVVAADLPWEESLVVADAVTPGLLDPFRSTYSRVWSNG